MTSHRRHRFIFIFVSPNVLREAFPIKLKTLWSWLTVLCTCAHTSRWCEYYRGWVGTLMATTAKKEWEGLREGWGEEKSISFIFRLPSRGGCHGDEWHSISHSQSLSHHLALALLCENVRAAYHWLNPSVCQTCRYLFCFFLSVSRPPPLSSLSLFDECVCAPTDNLLYMHIDVVSGSMAVFVSTPLSHHPTQSPL